MVLKSTAERVRRVLRDAGYRKDVMDEVATKVMARFDARLRIWMNTLPPYLVRSVLRRGLRAVHSGGFLFARVDRSPGRLVLLCREAWMALQRSTFLESARYRTVLPIVSEEWFIKDAEASLHRLLHQLGSSLKVRGNPRAGMPYAYWTVKNKSKLAAETPVVKLRPIIAHSCHPCRSVLSIGGRALSLVVEVATVAVQRRYPLHTPMWKLHAGSLEWVTKLLLHDGLVQCAEFDVEDCFLNTPRELVLAALDFWTSFSLTATRQRPWFSISKDGKHADHRGRPCSVHFWELSSTQLRGLVEWELTNNSTFQVVSASGRCHLAQHRGLPIGGHFSAALVELVALWREFTEPWPQLLDGRPTARYRDNYFVALSPGAALSFDADATAAALSALLAMPVKFEQVGEQIRCLELRLLFRPALPVHVTVAFRTDADRQGEAQNVVSWPGRRDPRTPRVLPGLLAGLAAKLRHYRAVGTGGFTASIRRAVSFVQAKGYPSKWWVRRFALLLLKQGVPAGCMPQRLRVALPTSTRRSQRSVDGQDEERALRPRR
jgi:hypothetical protein